MLPEEPPPPSKRACFCDQPSGGLEKNTFPLWKFPGLLINIVCSVGLPVITRFIHSPRPPAPIVGARRPRQSINPSLGLIDLVRSSAPPAAPLLLSPSVGNAQQPPPIPRRTLVGDLYVEVFSVYVDFPFSGTIGIFDERGGNYIYRRPDWDGDFYLRRQEWLAGDGRHHAYFWMKLLLTGPGRAMSASCDFSIQVETAQDSQCYALECEDCDDYSMQNKPRTENFSTDLGSLYVTLAVLSDALPAYVTVMVRQPWNVVGATTVHGNIMAFIGTFRIGSTLFSKDVDDAMDTFAIDSLVTDDSGIEFRLPLDRFVLAVPIGSCLHVKGELVFNVLENGSESSDTISVNHSIPIESSSFQSDWVQHKYCHTKVCLNIRWL